MDLRRRCNRGPEKKVQPWTLEEGATVDLRGRCNRGPEKKGATVDLRKKVQPWT